MKLWTAIKTSAAGILCSILGGYFNLAVERVNGGSMPAVVADCSIRIDATHVCATSATRLVGLSDWILFFGWLYSPGDVLLFVGQCLTILAVIFVLWVMYTHMPKRTSHW